MPLLLADFIYSRDCKLNLRKNVDTTWRVPGEWESEQNVMGVKVLLLRKTALH